MDLRILRGRDNRTEPLTGSGLEDPACLIVIHRNVMDGDTGLEMVRALPKATQQDSGETGLEPRHSGSQAQARPLQWHKL